MRVEFSKIERTYTGIELRPHFLVNELGIFGSALVAFIGPCHVTPQNLLDLEDRNQQKFIRAKWMVHFLGEFFGRSLKEGVLYQRLYISLIQEITNGILKNNSWNGPGISRKGNDLYVGSAKLSVSIATVSTVSQLLHIGININPEGAPVEAIGLQDLGIPVDNWIPQILEACKSENSQIDFACVKVKPV